MAASVSTAALVFLAFSCPLHAQAVVVRMGPVSPSHDAGQQLGNAIAHAVASGDRSASMTKLQQPGGTVLVNPKVTAAVIKATEIAEASATLATGPDAACSAGRNYTNACPAGWTLTHEGLCLAGSYDGSCANYVASSLSSFEKQQFAFECNAPFECSGEACLHDWSMCPGGYMSDENGFCRSQQQTVSEECALINIQLLSVAQKQEVAQTCKLAFPCAKLGCVNDYSQSCPDKWEEQAGGLCLAPPSYIGKCEFFVNVTGWTAKEKSVA